MYVSMCVGVSRGEAPGESEDPAPAYRLIVCPRSATKGSSVCVYMCVCAVLGKMWGGQGMNNGSTQQLTWSCSLWGLYTQMPTTRENEIQEHLLDRLSV